MARESGLIDGQAARLRSPRPVPLTFSPPSFFFADLTTILLTCVRGARASVRERMLVYQRVRLARRQFETHISDVQTRPIKLMPMLIKLHADHIV